MDYLASMFIDDELNLDEKVMFVDKIHTETPFYEDTRALLQQEKLLRLPPPDAIRLPARPPLPTGLGFGSRLRGLIKPLAFSAAGFAVAMLLIISLTKTSMPAPSFNRFVIYEPSARQVELTGSFSGWRRTPMQSIGDSGYWEVTLQLPAGEYRYAYILDGSRQMADPTMPAREKDDFGGENSILKVEEQV